MLKNWFTYLILLIICNANGQQYNFRTYSLKEGLSRSGVYYVLQDAKGFLWIGTEGGGLCKFDGYSFINYTRQDGLPSENVRFIFEDSKGTLWLGTDKGLCYKNGNSFKTINTSDGLCNDFVRTIDEDINGDLWIGTSFGISNIDTKSKKIISPKFNFRLPHQKVRTILIDSATIWIGTDKGLCRFNNNHFSVLTTESGLSNNLILSLFKDSKNNLWIGTKNGVTKLSDNNRIEYWTEVNGIINKRVRSINEDVYGNIWLGTKNGISIFNGRDFLNLSTKNGLSNERIRCISHDYFGNIWLGSYFGGIMRFNYKDFIAFNKKDNLISNQITCISEDEKGDLIVGSYEGVSKLKIRDNKLISVKHVSYKEGLLNNHVNCVLKDNNGYYWYGTDVGITVLKNNTSPIYVNTKDGLIDDNISVIKQIGSSFWVGTDEGIGIITPNYSYSRFKVNFISKSDGLSGNKVSCISLDSLKRIWVGFFDGQISIFEKDSIITLKIDSSVTEINTLTFDKLNRVWIGTNGKGIFYGSIENDAIYHPLLLKNISNKDHLSSNYIFSLLYDHQSIWVGNEKGLNLIEFKTDSTFFIQDFGRERGFLGLQNNLNASFKDHHSNLWFGTVNGLYFLNNREVRQYNKGVKSTTYITKVMVNHKDANWENSKYANGVKGVYKLPVDLTLPYEHNNISFEFLAINYISPEKIRYKWRLKGSEKEWSIPTSKNYVDYTNLNPGKYEFLLKSTNEKGEFTDELISFKFKITPPIWQSWWFITGAIIALLLLILEFLSWRTKQLRKKQEILENIVEERTKEVVAQKKVLEEKQKEIEHQNNELYYKNKEITDSIQYSKRIQKSILPSKEKVKRLLKNYFIFYRPKDIVSGDFFWIEQAPKNKNHIFFAAADCTGHGVPGAMVSMISTTALSSSLIEHQLTTPGLILDKTNEILIEAFTDHETGKIIKDGMDIALGSLNYKNTKDIIFEFSGAQNSAWIITSINEPNLTVNNQLLEPNIKTEQHKLFIIPATKQPIGYFDNKVPFKNYVCNVKNGYHIYLFSDGFADQFGGEKGKKYKSKKFKEFLLNIQNHSIDRQKLDIEQEFYNWKRDYEQLDDVCVIGVCV